MHSFRFVLEFRGYSKYKDIYLKSPCSSVEEGLPSMYVDLGLTSGTSMCKIRQRGEREGDEKARKGKEIYLCERSTAIQLQRVELA